VMDENAVGFYKLMYSQTHGRVSGDKRLAIFLEINVTSRVHYVNQNVLN
jgi:hypothetical protein